jgi:hypothetical protein
MKYKNLITVIFFMMASFVICKSQSNESNEKNENWDIQALDVARNVSYLSAIEKDVILEMNKVRTDPAKYAELYIKPLLQYFNGNDFEVPGEITMITQEGKKAVKECIDNLSKATAVQILTAESGLSLAAKDHANDQSKTGKTGHDGSDKSTFSERIKRYGNIEEGLCGENISYGPSTGREIVIQLLVDDGVKSRGHRKNIMKKDFSQTGVAINTHKVYRYLCVIEYAHGYKNN